MLDPVECEQARVSRNRAYDGRFFTECARRACTAGQDAPCGLHADAMSGSILRPRLQRWPAIGPALDAAIV